MKLFHPTEFNDQMTCPRLRHFRHELHLVELPNENMAIGTAVHIGLKYYYLPNWGEARAIENAINSLGMFENEHSELVQKMLEGYFAFDKENPIVREGDKVLYLEDKIESEKLRIGGTPDLVVDKGEYILIVDHKTSSGARSYGVLSKQAKAYICLVSELHEKPIHFMYNVLLKKFPSKPKFTKKGVLSKAAICTTREMFISGLLELGLDPGKYLDEINAINDAEFFKRSEFIVTMADVSDYCEVLMTQACDMLEQRGVPYGADNMQCTRCQFLDICRYCGDNTAKILNYVSGREEVDWKH